MAEIFATNMHKKTKPLKTSFLSSIFVLNYNAAVWTYDLTCDECCIIRCKVAYERSHLIGTSCTAKRGFFTKSCNVIGAKVRVHGSVDDSRCNTIDSDVRWSQLFGKSFGKPNEGCL